MKTRLFWLFISLFLSCSVYSQQASVAVANNFLGPLKALVAEFEKQSLHKIVISTGSTGQLYAQITNGAPFDLFLAADTKRPRLLVEGGLGVDAFTYAKGSVVLWSQNAKLAFLKDKALTDKTVAYIALPNPKLAPYGAAAEQVMQSFTLLDQLQDKLVLGKGLNVTYQYAKSGNAQLAFLAKSQVYIDGEFTEGSYWDIPTDLYSPIKQDAIVLNQGMENPAAIEFVDYLRGETAKALMMRYGYQ